MVRVISAVAAVAIAFVLLMVAIGRFDDGDEGGVDAVTAGMTTAEVRALAGAPQPQREDCWFYRASESDVSVCFVKRRFCVAGVCRMERRVLHVQAARS